MGNSSSKSRDDLNIGKSGLSSRNSISVPSAQRHRRSRSANPPNVQIPEPHTLPPPPYSAAPQPTLPEKDLWAPIVPPKTPAALAGNSSAGPSRPRRTGTYLRTPMRQETREDALETLRKFNTILLVDDSSSMAGALWHEATDSLSALADLAGLYDADGIDIYFLNDPRVGTNMKTAREVQKLFLSVTPRGITPIGDRLEELLRSYIRELERAQKSDDPAAMKKIKPVNYIIITDGAPTDDPESVIVQAAKRLDAGNFPLTQVGIQFVQIGRSRRATEFLQELDDGLSSKYQIRDMVDTTPYYGQLSADALVKILLGGINRRVDTKGASSVL